jgi:hypothetical protein
MLPQFVPPNIYGKVQTHEHCGWLGLDMTNHVDIEDCHTSCEIVLVEHPLKLMVEEGRALLKARAAWGIEGTTLTRSILPMSMPIVVLTHLELCLLAHFLEDSRSNSCIPQPGSMECSHSDSRELHATSFAACHTAKCRDSRNQIREDKNHDPGYLSQSLS